MAKRTQSSFAPALLNAGVSFSTLALAIPTNSLIPPITANAAAIIKPDHAQL